MLMMVCLPAQVRLLSTRSEQNSEMSTEAKRISVPVLKPCQRISVPQDQVKSPESAKSVMLYAPFRGIYDHVHEKLTSRPIKYATPGSFERPARLRFVRT